MNTKNAENQESKGTGAEVKDVQVSNVRVTNDDKVYFTLVVNDVFINNCRVATGSKGDFVSFPSYKGKNGNYYNYAYVSLDDKTTSKIMEIIQAAIDA